MMRLAGGFSNTPRPNLFRVGSVRLSPACKRVACLRCYCVLEGEHVETSSGGKLIVGEGLYACF